MQTTRSLTKYIIFCVVCVALLFLMRDLGAALIFFFTFIVLAFMRSGDFRTIVLLCVGAAMAAGETEGFVRAEIWGGGEAEILESETVPAGVLNPVEPVMISRKLWDGDKIIMVSDGVLEAMPGVEKERAFREFLDGLPDAGAQETAELILTFALSFEGEPRDDMTVLVGGIYG